MVAQSVTSTDCIAILSRRILNPRPVTMTTLARREKAAYRLCEQLQETLALLDSQSDGWGDVYRVLLRAYEVHSAACRKVEEAFEVMQAQRWEEEQMGMALQTDRSDFFWDSSVAD